MMCNTNLVKCKFRIYLKMKFVIHENQDGLFPMRVHVFRRAAVMGRPFPSFKFDWVLNFPLQSIFCING